ncbi:hypothetical protein Bca52824_029798 [Brassica carinata]|uniref:DUF4283 domain-containing protein n=1 Tax=Brassica carinata TaxID=52824 RepID=A0A8X7S785_BRACI|nr:hypothetical protein Bca52824_029798 [Brassica carinata]
MSKKIIDRKSAKWPMIYLLTTKTLQWPLIYLRPKHSYKHYIFMAYRNPRMDKGKWIADSTKQPRRPPVKIPAVDTTARIEEHRLTLIGRVTNPAIQKTRALVDFFLQHWRVAGTITGRDLGPHLFQFKFESERDLQTILSNAPYHFKKWMLILQRWEPIVSDYFPALIPFWITIHGLPLHYWSDTAIETIGNELGPVEDFDGEKARIRVRVNGLKPLEMLLDIRLPSGEIKQVELEYENLQKHCFNCFSLSHEKEDCPSLRAHANSRDSATRMGISQSRTLDRLDADRRKTTARKLSRDTPDNSVYQRSSNATQWQHQPSREFDWKQDKEFRFTYGARRDPAFRETSSRMETKEGGSRLPARARLSFNKDSTASSQKETSRAKAQTPRAEWRPIASGSRIETSSKSGRSQGSHTPSPRPQREGGSSLLGSGGRQSSGDNNPTSQDRRSALDRLSLPKERVPLLLDGAANADSGRLQEVDIQYLDETMPLHQSGGSNVPSSSKIPAQERAKEYDASQDRSPIRSLSEDRLHVSLRLGPLHISEEEEEEENATLQTSDNRRLKSTISIGLQDRMGKTVNPSPSKKRTVRSSLQGDNVHLEVLFSPANVIDTKIEFNNKSFYVSYIYGAPNREDRPRFWETMSDIGNGRTSPWLLMGDFNDLLDNSEKIGGPPRWEGSFLSFRNFVSMNGLWDLQFAGNSLSWRE